MAQLIDKSVVSVSLDFMEALDTPISLSVAILIRYGEWDQIAHKSVSPHSYLEYEVGKFKADYQAVSFLKKYPKLPLKDGNPRTAAFAAFIEAEHWCTDTNRRFTNYIDGYYPDVPSEILMQLSRARRVVSVILGKLPDTLKGGFGPGSVFEAENGDYGIGLTAYDKISEGWNGTIQWDDIEDSLLSQTALYKPLHWKFPHKQWPVVRGNRYSQVPKDARRNRSICIEPGANVWFQKGLGRAIRSALRRFNLDLDNNQAKHQKLAQEGSLNGTLSTIDLSNASDSVCYRIVEYMLPRDWFLALARYRSPLTRISKEPEVWLRNGKFSSMGNGYTFELETLIFAALVAGCGGALGKDSFVFGDDIIVPTEITDPVIKLLQFCGFHLNKEKSFTDGCFRESCGGDYFNGSDVRPYFLKIDPTTVIDWYNIHNGIYKRWSEFTTISFHKNLFKKTLNKLVESNIPKQYRLYGPTCVENGVLHGKWGIHWTTKCKDSIHYIKTYQPITKKKRRNKYGYEVQLAAALLGYRSSLSPRDAVNGFREKWIAF